MLTCFINKDDLRELIEAAESTLEGLETIGGDDAENAPQRLREAIQAGKEAVSLAGFA